MTDSTSVASDISTASRSKQVGVCVVFLDDTLHQFQVTRRTLGNTLYAQVIGRFRVTEPDYFDLEFYTSSGKQCWLERNKDVVGEWKKAVGEKDKDGEREKSSRKSASTADVSAADPVFYFSVKYFVPDPTQLRAENTRYLYALQIRRDLRTGQLFCSENTAALLISYIIQGDYGDFAEDFYLRARPFIRSHYKNVNLSTAANAVLTSAEFDALEQKIATYHRMHFGMSQSDANLCILDTARKIEFYGIRLYPVKDADNIQLAICVVHFGVLIFQSRIKINSFNWSKIKKISYKKKKFILKFRRGDSTDEEPRGQDGVLETIEFAFGSKEECRRFWQLVIDYHSFFRAHDTARQGYGSAPASESLRKRAELLQAAASQPHLAGSNSFLANPALADSAALTQSMYVTPSTPNSQGGHPFGSLQRAAVRRSMQQSMTPTPGARGRQQQPNGLLEHGSAPLGRHHMANAGGALPSRASFGPQPVVSVNGGVSQMQPVGRPLSGAGGYASDTLESVRTGYTSASSGSQSLHDQRSVRLASADPYHRQFSVDSAPGTRNSAQLLYGVNSDGQSSTGSVSIGNRGSALQQSVQCVCAANSEYRPLDSSGYGSSVLQRAQSAGFCCPQCGSRALAQMQQTAGPGVPASVRTPTNLRQPALSSGQLASYANQAAAYSAYEQQVRLSQGQLAQQPSQQQRGASSRSSTPHSHQQQQQQQQPQPILRQSSIGVSGQYGPGQAAQLPVGYYPGSVGVYPAGVAPNPFGGQASGPAPKRNSVSSPPGGQGQGQVDSAAADASAGGRVPDLSAYSQTVAVNTSTVNGRRGSAASNAGVNPNASMNATNGSNASQPPVDTSVSSPRPASIRQASPALGVSAIEAQQETRLKSFPSLRTQKPPAAVSVHPGVSSPQSASPPYTNIAASGVGAYDDRSDVRNSAALSMTASTISNGSDSTIPESTATGSSPVAPGLSSDAEAATPTLATAQSSTANTLTRSHQSSIRTLSGSQQVVGVGVSASQQNGASSPSIASSAVTPTSPPNGTVCRDAAAMRHIDSTTTTSADEAHTTASCWAPTAAGIMAQQSADRDSMYTPLATLSSGYPTSPGRPVSSGGSQSQPQPQSQAPRTPSSAPLSAATAAAAVPTQLTQSALSSDNQSYLALLALDAVCQERTYVKDLQIIAVHLAAYVRSHAAQFAAVEHELAAGLTQTSPGALAQLADGVTLLDVLVGLVAPLCDRHAALLGELEAVNTSIQAGTQLPSSANAFLDVFVASARFDANLYHAYLSQIDQLVFEYFVRLAQTSTFDTLVSKFEQDTKTCYLFVNDLLIKPLIHLHEYLQFLKKIENYVQLECTEQFAVNDNVLVRLGELSNSVKRLLSECAPRIERTLRYLGLLEIRKDVLLSYAPALDRATFARFGFLYKLSKKGYQQRMFFLFADFLLCANRTFLASAVQFRARHCYALADMQIASAGAPRVTPPDVQPSIGTHSFQLLITISSPQQQQPATRLLTLVANSEAERAGWLADLGKAIALAKQRAVNRSPAMPSGSGSDSEHEAAMLSLITQIASNLSVSDSGQPNEAAREDMRSPSASSPIATNSLVCVCWHRNNSLSSPQFSSLLENQISGYLLRKFQNSNGWQRLWSVFSKCCLFFYKSYQDEAPIASLPLWGYTVALADESDQIQKAFVFKLTYKTHKYYFRTENELAFNRWMQTLRAALMNNMQV